MALIPSVHETLGAAFIGFSLACGTFGVMSAQVFSYYRTFPHDRAAYKWLVATLWFLELLDQIFVGYSVYYYAISRQGNLKVLFLEDVVWPLVAQVVVGNLVGTLVKICFALRVWRFSHHNLWITVPIFGFILVQLGCAVAYCVRAFQLKKLLFAEKLRGVASIALGSGMATDALIALALCILLHQLRTGFKRSDSLINTLIIYAVNTGAVTGVVSLVTLLVYNILPRSFYFMAFYFILHKLYAISLLCALNTRKSVKGKGTEHQEPSANTGANTGASLQLHPRSVYIVSTEPRPGRYRRKSSPHFPYTNGSEIKSLEIGVHREISVTADSEFGRSTYV
ncbi:hypothetical protein BKA70DRAFT_781682 [Coprinopsis sp. MPI-PUGE-AT-0042]|nr:hypothetical protein BKA70DRAFT_781682 [Coprinopsis sp. MPI-PUGE-AT-0042]